MKTVIAVWSLKLMIDMKDCFAWYTIFLDVKHFYRSYFGSVEEEKNRPFLPLPFLCIQ